MNVKVEALDQHKVSLAIELPAEAVQKRIQAGCSSHCKPGQNPGVPQRQGKPQGTGNAFRQGSCRR